MPLRLKLALAALLIAVLAFELPAQEGRDCRQRTVPVNVLDKEGNQVWALTAADFRGEFRGQAVKILSAERHAGCRRVVILLDASGSMMGYANQWQLVRNVTDDLVFGSPSEVSLALMLFSTEVEETITFTAGRQAVAEKLTALPDEKAGFGKEERRTALLDAILAGLDLLQAPQVGDCVYVITDGADNASRSSYKEVERMLLEHSARLFGFLLPTPIYEIRRRVTGLATATGGNTFNFNSFRRPAFTHPSQWYHLTDKEEGALAMVMRQLYAQMAAFYRLEVELPRPVDRQQDWKLEVVDEHGKKRKELTVVYPRKLVPCAAEEAED